MRAVIRTATGAVPNPISRYSSVFCGLQFHDSTNDKDISSPYFPKKFKPSETQRQLIWSGAAIKKEPVKKVFKSLTRDEVTAVWQMLDLKNKLSQFSTEVDSDGSIIYTDKVDAVNREKVIKCAQHLSRIFSTDPISFNNIKDRYGSSIDLPGKMEFIHLSFLELIEQQHDDNNDVSKIKNAGVKPITKSGYDNLFDSPLKREFHSYSRFSSYVNPEIKSTLSLLTNSQIGLLYNFFSQKFAPPTINKDQVTDLASKFQQELALQEGVTEKQKQTILDIASHLSIKFQQDNNLGEKYLSTRYGVVSDQSKPIAQKAMLKELLNATEYKPKSNTPWQSLVELSKLHGVRTR